MKTITRQQLKTIFKKVKHLRLPQNLEEIDFENRYYLGWNDESDDICYIVAEVDGELVGLRGEVNKMPTRVMMKHLCTICRQQREFNEVMLFTAKNKRMPKGVDYRVSGVYICSNFEQCNADMKDGEEIQKFVRRVIFE